MRLTSPPGVTSHVEIFRIVPLAHTLVRRVGKNGLRRHTAGATLPRLWPTDSSWDSPLDYGPVLLLKPFRFHLAMDTLPSGCLSMVIPT